MKIVKKSKNCGRSLYLNVRKFKLLKGKKFVVIHLVGFALVGFHQTVKFRRNLFEISCKFPRVNRGSFCE